MKNVITQATGSLRKKAEELLKSKTSRKSSQLSDTDAMKLVHELEVYQIELELQNEELFISKQEALQHATKKSMELFDFAQAGFFTLSNKGEIIDINLIGSQMLGKARIVLNGSSFGFFVSDDSKPIFHLFLERVFESKTRQSCEITLFSVTKLPMVVLINGIVSQNGDQCYLTLTDITDLKTADVALAESQKLYADLVSNLTAGIYRILVQNQKSDQSILESTTIEFVSSRLCEILEVDPLEFSKDGIATFLGRIHPSDLEGFIKSNEIAQQTQEPYLKEARLKIGDRIKWIRFESSPRRLPNGSTRWTGVILEVTAQHLAEEALTRSEERQRFILESLPIAIYSSPINPDCDTKWINGDIKEITGFEKEQYLAENDFWRIRLHPDDKENVLNAFLNFPSSGELILEYRWKCKDGHYRWFMDRSVLRGSESAREFLGAIVDITDRKLAEETYRMLLEFASDGFFQGDKNGNLIIVNSVAIQQTGYTKEELLKMNMKDLFSFETLTQKPLKYTRVKTGEIVKMERELKRKDGKQMTIEMNSRIMPDGSFQSFFRDITERKLIEIALKRKLGELEIYYDLAITRERKMIALKSEINLLLERLGEKLKY
jgi:PAS domain S-box-containing protein